ncbi:hypothetical protein [Alteromonas sp. a30]|uniref:hypothetical protein n=1 Tax=Alteromonas sp. a30 TaxID=2730917 RepID=UPI0022824973|nr:hypothetical protein [Alteromonas sp. a30]MCY7296688.1 hypothetical protein [Alteromonas sp. a30]
MLRRLTPLLLIALSACVSRSAPEVYGNLLTNIRPDGTKLFVFTSGRGQQVPGLGALPSPSRRQLQRDRREYMMSVLEAGLEQKLESTGFCRTGYIPLGSYVERGIFEIRGECNESATKEDRVIFSQNSLSLYH